MKKSAAVTIPVLMILLGYICIEEALCRGGRGGGGGFGAGNAGRSYSAAPRSGGASQRSPSMSSQANVRSSGSQSRPESSGNVSSRPQRSQGSVKQASEASRPSASTGARPDTRPAGSGTHKPSQAQVQQFLDLPKHQGGGGLSDLGKVGVGAAMGTLGYAGAQHLLGTDRPGAGERPSRGEAVGPGDRVKPGTLPADRLAAGQRPSSMDRPANLPARANADQIRNNVKGRYDNLFTPQWWKDHPQMAQQYWNNFGRYQYGWNHWWRPATWAAVTGWIVGASTTYGASPAYYDYGESIYYEGDQVYEGGKPIATAEQYYGQAVSLASSAGPKLGQGEDWLPLGVFAVAAGQSTDSNMLLQLAVNKEGVIQGTYQNTTTGTARPVRGRVDKKTQRAAWTFADGKNTDIIMETGLFNLTQDQAEALVHFGKDKTQQWLMVRLPQPADEKPPQAS